MTAMNTQTTRILKIALIFGHPIAFLGLFLVLRGFASGTDETFAIGILTIFIGFIATWFGKIGLFWFR